MEQCTSSGPGPSPPDRLPVFALQRADAAPERDALAGAEAGDGPGEPRYLACRICGTTVTTQDSGIEVNGSHRHTFMNPGGIVFSIGCFSGAGGCHLMGAPTEEYTWFPGYAWRYGICSGCLSHLGWHYHSAAGGFYGLILDRLVLR